VQRPLGGGRRPAEDGLACYQHDVEVVLLLQQLVEALDGSGGRLLEAQGERLPRLPRDQLLPAFSPSMICVNRVATTAAVAITRTPWGNKHARNMTVRGRLVRVERLERLNIVEKCLGKRVGLSCHRHHVLLVNLRVRSKRICSENGVPGLAFHYRVRVHVRPQRRQYQRSPFGPICMRFHVLECRAAHHHRPGHRVRSRHDTLGLR
jgi:hypothetical protein